MSPAQTQIIGRSARAWDVLRVYGPIRPTLEDLSDRFGAERPSEPFQEGAFTVVVRGRAIT